jgi:GTP cyclohydrolase II
MTVSSSDVSPLEHVAEADLPTVFGDFRLHVFRNAAGAEHMAIVAGTPVDGCLVRLHSECATGDILGSLRCDCRQQLELALRKIAEAGSGLVIYMRGHEGRGIGLANKIRAYALQDKGMDTVDANLCLGFPVDARNYADAAAILRTFGLGCVRLMTNNTQKVDALEGCGIKVSARLAHWTSANAHNENYLTTKKSRMGHLPR